MALYANSRDLSVRLVCVSLLWVACMAVGVAVPKFESALRRLILGRQTGREGLWRSDIGSDPSLVDCIRWLARWVDGMSAISS